MSTVLDSRGVKAGYVRRRRECRMCRKRFTTRETAMLNGSTPEMILVKLERVEKLLTTIKKKLGAAVRRGG